MAEPADATEDEEEDFDRVDDILVLEGEPASDRLDHFQAVAPQELIREQAIDPLCTRIREEMDAGRTRTFKTEAEEFEGTLCRTAAESVQVVIPQSLKERVLGLSHYAKLAGHPGGRKLYKTLRRHFYWPSMALDCYAVAKNLRRMRARKGEAEKKHEADEAVYAGSSVGVCSHRHPR